MDKPLTLVEHLAELRKRIIISLAAFGLAALFSLPFGTLLLKVLKLPAQGVIEKLAVFSPQEAFMIYMRLAFLAGLIISMPVILFQVWEFISPATGENFRKQAGSFISFCFLAFICGGVFAYFILIPPALKFLMSFTSDELTAVISANKYISFVVSLIVASGLVFQMPILSFLLSKIGIISAQSLRRKYKYAIVVIFIVSAVITPTPDAFNMLLLALPMLVLYEVSIWVAYFTRPSLR